MRFAYTEGTLAQGRDNQLKQMKEPNTFGRINSADNVTQKAELDDSNSRMAGQVMTRFMEYMNNPQEQMRTDDWNARFSMSNEGAAFNMAKMNGGMLPDENQNQGSQDNEGNA